MLPGPTDCDGLPHAKIALLRVILIAQEGRFDEAEQELLRFESYLEATHIADLRARINVLRGNSSEARKIWEQILKDDPGNTRALGAIRALNAEDKKRSVHSVVTGVLGLLCAALLIGAISIIWGNRAHNSHPRVDIALIESSKDSKAGDSVVDAPADTSTPDTLTVEPVITPDPVHQSSTSLDEYHFIAPQIDGFEMRHDPRGVMYVPLTGMFSYRTELADGSRDLIERFASSAAPLMSNAWMVVTGHTDSEPIPPSSSYKSNYDLGLDRARAVSVLLRDISNSFGDNAVLAASAGGVGLLFEEKNEHALRQNRSVSFHFIPRSNTSVGSPHH